MVQDTSIQSCYSDLLWPFQLSQWGGNCHLFLPLFHWVFSQAIKKILFISAWPDLATDHLSPREFSSHPLPVITALHSQTLQKSWWKHLECQPLAHWGQLLNPDWTPNSSWCSKSLSTIPSPCGEGSVPKNSPSSPAQGCPSSLHPIEARCTWIPQIILVDVPCCAMPPQCSPAWKISLSLWMSRKIIPSWCASNCLTSMEIQKGVFPRKGERK